MIIQNGSIQQDFRVWQEAKTLINSGYTVSVICPGYGNRGSEILDGIHVYYYKEAPLTHGAFSFLIEFVYTWLRTFFISLRILHKPGFDIIHASNPPDTFFLLGWIYGLLGKKFVYDQHDLCPEIYLSRFEKNNVPFLKILTFLEKMTYRTADVVISPNESYKEIAKSRGNLPEEKIFLVRTGPDLDRVKETSPDRSLKNGRRFLVSCAGDLNPQDGVDYLLEVVDYLVNRKRRDDIHFAVLGDGDSLPHLKRMAIKLNVTDHVTFPGWLTGSRFLEYLSTTDVCIAPDPKNQHNDVSTINCVMEYMALGKPVVAFALRETPKVAGAAALYAKPNDSLDMASKLEELLNDEKRRKWMGEHGRKRIEQDFSWYHSEKLLLEAYNFLNGKSN